MTRAVVIGQSHCNSIATALEGERDGIAVYRVGVPFAEGEEPFTFSAAMRMVAGLSEKLPIFVSTLGAYHNQLGLLESGTPFDFLLEPADETAAPPPAVRVPNRAVASAFNLIFNEAVKIRKLKRAARAPIYMLSTPPPKQDNAFVKSILMKQKKKVYNGRSFLEFDVERPEIRLKLWRLEARLLEQWSALEDMHFVAAPEEAFDEAGFLSPRFYEDATHANAQYGSLVVDQIRMILARERANG